MEVTLRRKVVPARAFSREAVSQQCPLPLHDRHVQALSEDVAPVALGGGVVFWSGPLDENLIRHPSRIRLGDEAVDKKGRQAVNQAPSRHPSRIVFARPIIGASSNALKKAEDRAGSLIKLREFRPLDQNGSE